MYIQFELVRYKSPAPGGTRYPDLGNVAHLDWIECGTRLVLFMNANELEAAGICEANKELRAKVVSAEKVSTFVWADFRNWRRPLIAKTDTIYAQYLRELRLKESGDRKTTTRSPEDILDLDRWIEAVCQFPQVNAYPGQNTWPQPPQWL